MKDGGRLSAAIEVLTEVETRHRPVQLALKDWGIAHRFAGSGDRTAIGNLVFDALRHRSSLSARIGSADPRLAIFATYVLIWQKSLDDLSAVLEADRHAPEGLSEAETEALVKAADVVPQGADAADVPQWLWAAFETVFGEMAVEEGKALAARAPIDMRTNTLKSDRERLSKRLSRLEAEETPFSPTGLRIRPKPGALRMPHVQAEEEFQKGWFELQDEASQIAALLAGAKSGDQVLDFCAGGGGKTLALAATMENRGQLFAYDADKLRLAPIHDRIKRAGVRNIQVLDPSRADLTQLEDKMDIVFVDAPCTGTGVWRRRPDSKWKLSEKALADRQEDQMAVLDRASGFVKPGGRLVYVTCSVLPEENSQQIDAFLQRNEAFEPVSALEAWTGKFPAKPSPTYVNGRGDILLTPASTDTDGFFVSLMQRRA